MRVFVPMVFFVTLNVALAEYEQRGGWTPISNEEAYRRLHVHIPRINNILRIDRPWNENFNLTAESNFKNKNDGIKLVEPKQVYGEFEVKMNNFSSKTNNIKLNGKLIDAGNIAKIETTTSKSTRKAKNIDECNSNAKNIKMNAKTSDLKENHNYYYNMIDDTLESTETQIYEVTPSPEETDLEPIKEGTKSGYVYSLPKIKSQQVYHNLTNNFLDILDKYNINNKDKLTNYAKSRVANIQNISKQQIVYLPLPIRFLDRYNSLNHLSVNPLMAVFLSNYGCYLPYTYGVHNNYRNLYGYLASNNIHNNKPFGNYKVFSDTDSSN